MALALQSIFGGIAENIWILIPLTALFIPIVAIVCEPIKQRLRMAERREARETYERLAREKLDVLRAGITMGYSQRELQDLDGRLEKLIGADKLRNLLDPKRAAKLDKEMETIDNLELEAAVMVSRGKTTG